ncbi:hypothetical protein [Streptomyces sp. NPDC014894]|uniref:hypothetical protein n=1 Tax=unclassified Streptomyces TaxID=2593676 RepID=UPI0036FB06B9
MSDEDRYSGAVDRTDDPGAPPENSRGRHAVSVTRRPGHRASSPVLDLLAPVRGRDGRPAVRPSRGKPPDAGQHG